MAATFTAQLSAIGQIVATPPFQRGGSLIPENSTQARISFSGQFTGCQVTINGSMNGDAAAPNWEPLPLQNGFTLAQILSYPIALTDAVSQDFFCPNLLFYNSIQIILNQMNPGSAPVNVTIKAGSFLSSLPGLPPAAVLTSLLLEMTRLRVALSDQNNTDYAAAVATTDLGKV